MGHLITMQGHSGKDKHSVGPPDFHFVTRDIIQGLRVPDGGPFTNTKIPNSITN